MSAGISYNKLTNRHGIGRRSKHTQYDPSGHPVGSNTKKGKRAY